MKIIQFVDVHCMFAVKLLFGKSYASIIFSYLSNVSSSKLFKSQAIYSKAASVILEHQLRSKERSLGKFSAINSTPSSVTLLHPESDSTVRLGKECTEKKERQILSI